MKYLFLILLSLPVLTLTAQSFALSVAVDTDESSSQSITEMVSDDGYQFTVKLDRGQREHLVSAFETVVGYELTVKVTGLVFEEYDNGIVVELNTRRNKLSVDYGGNNDETLAEAKELAVRIKEVLNIAPAAAPRD